MSSTEEQDPTWLSTLITDSPSIGQMVKGHLDHEVRWRDAKIAMLMAGTALDATVIEKQKRLITEVGQLNQSQRKMLINYEETINDIKLVLEEHERIRRSLEKPNDQKQGSNTAA